MEKDGKIMLCIVGSSVRDIVNQSNKIGIQREDIVGMFTLREQVYLIYFK